MKVISFCLYGNNEKYYKGMIENIILANLIYLGWQVRIYTSIGKQKIPDNVMNILQNMNCKIIECKELYREDKENSEGMFWRFKPIFEKDVDIYICRDADSRISIREKQMVEEWIENEKCIHTILDHPCHKDLMGCSFGINCKIVRSKYSKKIADIDKLLLELTNNGTKYIPYNTDQPWIRTIFKNIILENNDIFVHYIGESNTIYGIIPNKFTSKLMEPVKNFCGIRNTKYLDVINDLLDI